MNPEAWFVAALGKGLARLVALGLPGTPPAETIRLTQSAWADALWTNRRWNPDDEARIAEAFRLLAARVDRWPAPKQFVDFLPRRKDIRKLAEPKPDPAQRTGRAARFRSIKNLLNR